MVNINFIVNVVIQVLCIFIFLSIFFFTYASKVEGEIVQNQVTFLVNDIVGIHLDSLPNAIKQILLAKINNIQVDTPENAQISQQIDASNSQIKMKTIKTLGTITTIVVVFVIVCVVLKNKGKAYFQKLNLPKILKEAGIIITAVALTEFSFLTYLGSKYTSIDPNGIKAHLVGNIINGLPN